MNPLLIEITKPLTERGWTGVDNKYSYGQFLIDLPFTDAKQEQMERDVQALIVEVKRLENERDEADAKINCFQLAIADDKSSDEELGAMLRRLVKDTPSLNIDYFKSLLAETRAAALEEAAKLCDKVKQGPDSEERFEVLTVADIAAIQTAGTVLARNIRALKNLTPNEGR